MARVAIYRRAGGAHLGRRGMIGGMRLPFRFQFSLATLLAVMVLAGILLAALGGMLRESQQMGSGASLVYFLMLTASPIALVIAISCARGAAQAWSKYRNRR